MGVPDDVYDKNRHFLQYTARFAAALIQFCRWERPPRVNFAVLSCPDRIVPVDVQLIGHGEVRGAL